MMIELRNFITNLWQKTVEQRKLNFFEHCVFLFLNILEYPYRVFFWCINFLKLHTGSKRVSFKVISVGNISVGGTGKSVFISMLVDLLKPSSSAILLRGYGGSNVRKKESLLVCDGKEILSTPEICGDEAFMHSTMLNTPVVVGKNRFKSANLLNDLCQASGIKIEYILLDDAYQNHQLKKDFEILLLDARKPFENGHCLPAGALREKDLSRSDVVVLTHADKITGTQLELEKQKLISLGVKYVFAGKHVSKTMHDKKMQQIDVDIISGKKVFAFAGIGSFDQFKQTVDECLPSFGKFKKFEDHHEYTQGDLDEIYNLVNQIKFDFVVTTLKDWVKIKNIIMHDDKFKSIDFYVLDVGFEFLNDSEYSRLECFIHNKLCLKEM